MSPQRHGGHRERRGREHESWSVRLSCSLALVAAIAAVASCSSGGTPSAQTAAATAKPQSAAHGPTENVYEFSPGVWSGSAPEGDAGFAVLQAMGIRTVISVDGASPNLESARAHGMNYIHVPIAYSGLSREQEIRIASAISGAEGPLYLHCHHGKHRGPAAAATALVCLGEITSDEGEALMRRSGTSDSYPGLYRAVRTASPAPMDEIEAATATLTERAVVTGMVYAMAEIERTFERLGETRLAGWRAPDDHPDLVPAAEAGMLADRFRDLVTDPDTLKHDAAFQAEIKRSHEMALALEEALVAAEHKQASDLWQNLKTACSDCHAVHRNRDEAIGNGNRQ